MTRSPALRVTGAFGISGVAFTLGNLLLARVLPASEYGVFALVTGLLSISTAAAPMGIDQVVNRRHLAFTPELWRRVVGASAVAAAIAVVVAGLVYRLNPPLLLALATGTFGGGITAVAAAYFQSKQRFQTSVPMLQAPNLATLGAAILAAVVGASHAAFPSAILAGSYVAAAALGVWIVRQDGPAAPTSEDEASWHWGESLSLVALLGAGLVFMQLERLVIPRVLTYEDLATFGVVSSLVASPFRMLQNAVFYTIIPRLRGGPPVEERRRILALEGTQVTLVMGVIGVLVWFLTPLVSKWLLAGKYELSNALIIAMLVSGVLKVVSVFPTSVVTALADRRRLGYLSILAWVTVALGAVAGAVGARWGLTGLVYGVAGSWLLRSASAAFLAAPYLTAPRTLHSPG